MSEACTRSPVHRSWSIGLTFPHERLRAAVAELRRMHVYTPPEYEHNSKTYPVFYLLHGSGDTDDSWPTVGRAGAILDNLIAEHKAVPMLVVMRLLVTSRETFSCRPARTQWATTSSTRTLPAL